MRVKNPAKRDAIVTAARELFMKLGYQRTSMDMIVAHMGGSKSTLYNYFDSKKALFIEVVKSMGEKAFESTVLCLQPDAKDLGAMFRSFGEAYITASCKPEIIAGRRMVMAEVGEAGALFYNAGPERGNILLTEFFRRLMDSGRIIKANPRVAARQLLSLLEAETLHATMFGVLKEISKEEVKHVVDSAVTTFMKVYAA